MRLHLPGRWFLPSACLIYFRPHKKHKGNPLFTPRLFNVKLRARPLGRDRRPFSSLALRIRNTQKIKVLPPPTLFFPLSHSFNEKHVPEHPFKIISQCNRDGSIPKASSLHLIARGGVGMEANEEHFWRVYHNFPPPPLSNKIRRHHQRLLFLFHSPGLYLEASMRVFTRTR